MTNSIVDRIKTNQGYFDRDYRLALARREFAREAAADKPADELRTLAKEIVKECDLEKDAVSIEWYETEQRRHIDECCEKQGEVAAKTDELKLDIQSQSERLKALKADLENNHNYLNRLAKEISSPWIPELPPMPSPQRQLPLDGEEWRAVALSKVLHELPAMEAVAEKQLGKITLGDWADFAMARTNGGPKKITDKQFDKIEEAVQKWHAEQSEEEGSDDA